MNLLQTLLNQADQISNYQSEIPLNAINLMMPSDGVPFIVKFNFSRILVIEKYDDDSNFKLTYYVDASIAEQLPKNNFAHKFVHVLQTLSGEIRFALMSQNPTNSWNRSKLEGIKVSDEGNVISMIRDKEANVYAHKIEHDIPLFEIDMNKVAESFKETFSDQYYINSLEHPMIKDLLTETGEIVDVDESSLGNELDEPFDSVDDEPTETQKDSNHENLIEMELDKVTLDDVEIDDVEIDEIDFDDLSA